MGKFLIVKGADFSENGMPFGVDMMPVFATNMLPLGTALLYSGNDTLIETETMTRIACGKTTIVSNRSSLNFKVKTGFQIAMVAITSNNVWASTNPDGTLSTKTYWEWVTSTDSITIDLTLYKTFAINIRHSDNTTAFTSNNIYQALDYIIAE